jgi:hypothetical protein
MGTNLISALFAAQVGRFQLAVAARLAQTDPQSGTSVTQLIDAAEQNSEPLADVPADLGSSVDITC